MQQPGIELNARLRRVEIRGNESNPPISEFQLHWLKQFSWLEYKSLSAGAGVATQAGIGGATDWRDNDGGVDVEGGESDRTAKNTETELSMRMFCKYCCKYEKAFLSSAPQYLNWRVSKLTIVLQAI